MAYKITFTNLARAAAEASSSLAAVEAKARAEIIALDFGVEDALPSWGFHTFEMPDGQEFIASFQGERNELEIDTVGRHESIGPIENAARLGMAGEVSFPVRATKSSGRLPRLRRRSSPSRRRRL